MSHEELRKTFEGEEDYKLEMIIGNFRPDSYQHQIAKDVLRKRRIKELEEKDINNNKDTNTRHWYEKPIGATILTVIGGIIMIFIAAWFKHMWPHWFS